MQHTKALLSDLVACDSTRHREAAVARMVRHLFADRGYRIVEQPVASDDGEDIDGRVNLIIERGQPRLYFFGHLDTVSAGEVGAWSGPPLQARERDGRIHGLGACDMKGGLAALLSAVLEAGPAHIGLCLTCDEEGKFDGVGELVRRGHPPLERAELAVFAEPTDLEIVARHRGCIEIDLQARGRAAHAAMPELGRDAARLYDCLRSLAARLAAEQPPTALNIGYFEAGDLGAINVVPDRARAVIDVRPGAALQALGAEHLAAEITRCAAAHGLTVSHRVNIDMRALDCPPERLAPLAQAIEQTGLPVRFGRLEGTSEAGEVSRRFGLPCANFGPGPAAQSHQPDEYVTIESLAACRRVYAALIASFGTPRG